MFGKWMKAALPNVILNEPDIDLAQHFVLCMLNPEPRARPSAEQMLEHPFLKSREHLECGDTAEKGDSQQEDPAMGKVSSADVSCDLPSARDISVDETETVQRIISADCRERCQAVQDDLPPRNGPATGRGLFTEAHVRNPTPREVSVNKAQTFQSADMPGDRGHSVWSELNVGRDGDFWQATFSDEEETEMFADPQRNFGEDMNSAAEDAAQRVDPRADNSAGMFGSPPVLEGRPSDVGANTCRTEDEAEPPNATRKKGIGAWLRRKFNKLFRRRPKRAKT